MKKMKILLTTVCVITFFTISNFTFGQKKLIHNGIEFSIDKVKYGGMSLIKPIKENTLKRDIDTINYKITRSKDKKTIALIEDQKIQNISGQPSFSTANNKSKVNVYQENGKKRFSKDYMGYYVTKLALDDGANFVHVNIDSCDEEDNCISKLFTYNNKGEVLKEFKTSAKPLGAYKNKKIVYYTYSPSNSNYNKLQTTTHKLVYNNYSDNESWEKEFVAKRLKLVDINANGERILIRKDNKIIAINNISKTIWQKDIAARPGIFSLSDNGTYLMNIATFGDLKVFDMNKNEIILEKSLLESEEGNYRIILGGFVTNSENNLFFIDWFKANNGTDIGLFDISGRNITNIRLPNININSADIVELCYENNELLIYHNGLLVKSENINW